MHHLICAGCQGDGRSACKNCRLVLYCSAECQKKHWPIHKQDCKSPISKDTWKPGWELEGRPPLFVGGAPFVTFGGQKQYLWGNVPAIDVLRLEANEGADYKEDLRLLFAASGDLRNVVKTVAAMPASCSSAMSITINDRDFDIVARNAILLLITLLSSDVDQATDCMIHVWYSAMLTEAHMKVLQSVRKLVEDVCSKTAGKAPDVILGKTWRFESTSLRLELTKDRWSALLAFFDVPDGLTGDRANSIRTAVTLAYERRDHRDRANFARPSGHRLSAMRFREDGVLLPFGASREAHTVPNPTMFQAAEWPMSDSAEPLAGWSHTDLHNTQFGPADNDIYGKFFKYVTGLLTDFYNRVWAEDAEFDFRLLHVAAEKLETHVKSESFARVETSNISDTWCLGAVKTVAYLGPFLESPTVNANATLITLFMNAVGEMAREGEATEEEALLVTKAELFEVMKYIPYSGILPKDYEPIFLMRSAARALVRDNDKYFNKYMERHQFKDIEQHFFMRMKDPHTVIDKWPTRFRHQPNDPGAKKAFRLLLASLETGAERYVEWKRTT